MGRIAFTVRIQPDQIADVRNASKDFNAAFEDFALSRKRLGLTALSAWLQEDEVGPCLVLYLEGDLESYFSSMQTESGIDEYIRQKVKEWTGSDEDALAALNYPQAEMLFDWSET